MVYQHRYLAYLKKAYFFHQQIQAGSVVGLSEAWLVNECIASLLFVPQGWFQLAFHPFVEKFWTLKKQIEQIVFGWFPPALKEARLKQKKQKNGGFGRCFFFQNLGDFQIRF